MSTSPTLAENPEVNSKADAENGHDLKDGAGPGEENGTSGKVSSLVRDTPSSEDTGDTKQAEGVTQTGGDVINDMSDPAKTDTTADTTADTTTDTTADTTADTTTDTTADTTADPGVSSTQNGDKDPENMDTTDASNLQPEEEKQENGVEEKDNSKADDVDSGPEDNPMKVDAPLYDTQKSEIHAQLCKPLQSGQKWYLIHIRWFKQWKRYVGYDNWDKSNAGEQMICPGPIDNSSLLEQRKLRRHQVDEIDYKLVPEDAWKKLASWYGLSPDSIAISRRVVEYGKFVKQCKVEIYPLELKACLYPKESDFIIVRISRCDTIRVLEKKIRKAFIIEQSKEVRVYNRYMTYTYELIKDLSLEAQDVGLFDGQCVLLEVQNQDASWPRTNQATRSMQMGGAHSMTTRSQNTYTSGTSYSSGYSYSGYGYYSGRQPTTPGLCGLSNLGNTCFMNSGLQCLVHIPSLIEYFKSDTYLTEINTKNPLGMKGELAKSFGDLIKAMWSGDYAYLAPRDYKLTVGKFAPTFSGYAQQDSQEHISFLLDGLHEDLNRVVDKPYIELKEVEAPDEKAAQESWDRHLRRNKSIIVDTFQGQYKSTLVCPECSKVSITFDPFMYLSLPLPIKKTRNIKLTVITLNPAIKPKVYKVKVPKNSRVREFCEELAKLCGIEADRFVVCDVYSHRFHKIFDHTESVNGITERDDIFVYETPIDTTNDPNLMCLPMYNRELRRTQYTSIGTHSYVHHYLFGMPLVLPLPRDTTTYKDLYRICVFFMSRYVFAPEEFKAQLVKAQQAKTDTDRYVNMENNDSGNNSDSEANKNGDEDRVSGDETTNQDQLSNATDPTDNTDNTDNTNNTNNTDNANNTDNTDNTENTQINTQDSSPELEDISMDTEVKSKLEPEDEQAGDMEVEGATAGPVHSFAYVPDSFDISLYPPDMFKLKLVNAYGSAEMGELRDDGNYLRLMNRSVIAMEWNSKYRSCYSEATLRDINEDESVYRKDIKKEIHLNDCIKLFTEKEILSKDDPWYCPQCKDFRQASKQLELWKIPECLVIHLKRFSYNAYWRDKLDSFINYPLELDMTNDTLSTNQGCLQYELFGVSNHFGGLGGGHYTAYAKHKDSSKWYNFDDSSVMSYAQNDSVVTKAGYLLFYIKKTCIPLVPTVAKKEPTDKKEAISDDSGEVDDPVAAV